MALIGWLGQPAYALESVQLHLKYLHQFQFAGYYAALEKGYYRDAGLDVQIVEGHSGNEPLDNVLPGRSQGNHDIKGQRVMMAAQSEELIAYLKQEGTKESDITRVQHSFNPRDLMDGRWKWLLDRGTSTRPRSSAPGLGTTFTITLPLTAPTLDAHAGSATLPL